LKADRTDTPVAKARGFGIGFGREGLHSPVDDRAGAAMTPLHRAATLFAGALRLLPMRLRWPILVHAARLAAPIVRWVDSRGEPGLGMDGFGEIALWRLMMAAAEAGLRYDPIVDPRGV
jgi:hypothetical protein